MCLLAHAREKAEQEMQLARHNTTEGDPGIFLSVGSVCPCCGSLDGGWACAGEGSHLSACWEVTCLTEGGFQPGCSGVACCVHGPTQKGSRTQSEWAAILKHLRQHGQAADQFLERMQAMLKATRRLGASAGASGSVGLVVPTAFRERVAGLKRFRQNIPHRAVMDALGVSGDALSTQVAGAAAMCLRHSFSPGRGPSQELEMSPGTVWRQRGARGVLGGEHIGGSAWGSCCCIHAATCRQEISGA